jgi:hypothetical protein
MCPLFGTLFSIFIGGESRKIPAYTTSEDGTEYSETAAHKIQTPGNPHPLKKRIQH